MAERRIVLYGDPVLREKAAKVDEINQEVKDLVSDLVDALKGAQGLGLAAPQIGVSKRVFVVDLSVIDLSESVRVFINPEIVQTDDEIELEEGCLSFPGIYQRIVRPAKVRVRALDINGEQFEMTFDGLAARAVLHENDHLNGVLFIDHISPLTRTMLKGKLKKLAAAS
ncbi:MAG: peptide deformylase [Candidatus Zixiibacteriota bacterium]|nr:MAG: peptide deformylase [candidate division Zixibacteria bacterium]